MNQSVRFLESATSPTPYSTQIKVCGITRVSDALYAAECGVDAVGFIFYPPSPRNLTCEKAKAIRQQLPESVASVAVVVDPNDTLLNNIVELVQPDFIQFHGNESQQRCTQSGIPFYKAFRVNNSDRVKQSAQKYKNAQAILLDAYVPDKVGGTGKTFAWNLVPELQLPVILAGGLHCGNIADAIRTVKPHAVDVSTGVESAAGVKDCIAVRKFVEAVRKTDSGKRL